MSILFQKSNERSLMTHPVFSKIEYAIAFQIDRIDIAHKAKRNMIHAFLKLYFSEFKKAMTKYIETFNPEDNPITFITLYNRILNDINDEALCAGIPEIFVKRYQELCRGQTQSVYVSLENIINSAFYGTAEDKLTAMLDIMMCHFVFITLDAEKTLNDLNGKMEIVLAGSIFE